MPSKGGRFIRFRRYNPLPSALVPLGNGGITPPATNLSALDIDTEMQFYGQFILLNEQVN